MHMQQLHRTSKHAVAQLTFVYDNLQLPAPHPFPQPSNAAAGSLLGMRRPGWMGCRPKLQPAIRGLCPPAARGTTHRTSAPGGAAASSGSSRRRGASSGSGSSRWQALACSYVCFISNSVSAWLVLCKANLHCRCRRAALCSAGQKADALALAERKAEQVRSRNAGRQNDCPLE